MEGVSVTVTDPQETELWTSTDTSGNFKIEMKAAGKHQLCFKSSIDENQMISFNIWQERPAKDEAGVRTAPLEARDREYVTKNHTARMAELVSKLEARSEDILTQQQYAITREAVHRDAAETTNHRVLVWTLAEVLTLIALATIQIYYLRSCFEMKQVV
eukprot:NODE_25577_length_582_cov_2.960440.p1 GENE.NODE_25577_length_582_cov_2.960440~~NODE_25577_length_582_cov_2.960440.p1  ORF type:complete len:187 (-),score=78.44 NODE_25577_length_582_cov_2.960440:22-498(-)